MAMGRGCAMVMAGALGLAIMSASAQASMLVDDFSSFQSGKFPYTVLSGGAGQGTSEFLPTLPGKARSTFLTNVTGGVTGYDSATLNLFGNGTVSFLDYQSSVAASAVASLSYGTLAAGTAIGWNFNPATDSIQLTLLGYDEASGGPLSIVTTVQSGTTDVLVPDVEHVTTSGPQTVTISLASVAVSTLDGVQFNFTAPAGTDFRIGAVNLVNAPEPASLGLLGLGAAALMRRRRR